MVAVKITAFQGKVPRLAERLLPDTSAQEADNVNLTSGEIRPVRPAAVAYSPPDSGVSHLSAYRAVYGESEKWRTWTMDVDVARAPFSYDVEPRYYWTGDGCPRYANHTEFGTVEYALGLPAPANKPAVTSTGGSGSVINRTYCYTSYQPTTGEESAPSPVADVIAGKVDDTWTVTGFSGIPANTRAADWNTVGLKQRLYRTSGTAANFQLVAERDAVTTDWVDMILDADMLGDDLISADWLPPPENLLGIIALPNGALCGFGVNLLCYSEPYQPHAWPIAYQSGTDFPISGISSFGTTVVAATSAYPYVFSGSDPSVVTPERVNNVWPCLSKRSVASVGDGVIFATSYGLAYVGQTGPTMWTNALYTSEEWKPLNPSSMVTAVADGRVFVAYTPVNGETAMLMFHPGESALLTTYSLSPKELYADATDGRLYLVDKVVKQWDSADGERLLFNWLSKEIELPEPVNLGAAKIDWVSNASPEEQAIALENYVADITYNAGLIDTQEQSGGFGMDAFGELAISDSLLITPRRSSVDYLAITLYIDGHEVFTREVLTTDAFRLPAGFKRDFFSVRLTGTVRVKSVKVAETMVGLKQV